MVITVTETIDDLFDGIEGEYDPESEEIVIEINFTSEDENTYDITFDAAIDLNDTGSFDATEPSGLSVYSSGSVPLYLSPDDPTSIDKVRVCLENVSVDQQ